MKNINISSIILAAEKAEKAKTELKYEAGRALKKAEQCATAEGKAKWQEIANDFLNELVAYDVSFYKPLDDTLTAFEKSYRVRNFETAEALLEIFLGILNEINIPKKYFDGTTILVRAYAGTFPAAYKGTPTTTEAIFINKNGKWYLTNLDRVTVKKDRTTCVFSVVTKEAIVKKYEKF